MEYIYKWIVLSSDGRLTASELDRLAEDCKNVPDHDPRLCTPSAKRLISSLENPPVDNAYVICYPDKNYPQKLKLLKNPPPALYVWGNPSVLMSRKSMAVVGSRQASAYGLGVTADFCRDLCEAGFVIISGGAKGIDSAAAQTAIKFGGATIAVMGCGADVAYPAENKALFDRIVKSGGAMVSEYPFGTAPSQGYFPQRNRIIAALSDGCLITEAGLHSGSLITANLAADMRKPLFAVPGNITSKGSSGTNHLISTGARMALSGTQVAAELELMLSFAEVKVSKPSKFTPLAFKNKTTVPKKRKTPSSPKKHQDLSGDEKAILAALGDDGKSLAELAVALNMPSAKLLSALTMLELKGVIKKQFGEKYKEI